MFKCNVCGEIFETPIETSAENFYGVGSDFGNSFSTIKMCPHCEETDFEEYNEEEQEEQENEEEEN